MQQHRKWYEHSQVLLFGCLAILAALSALDLIDKVTFAGLAALVGGLIAARHADELQEQNDRLERRLDRLERQLHIDHSLRQGRE